MSSLSLALLSLLASTHALPTSGRFSARNANAYDRYLMKRAAPAAGSVTGTVGLGDNSDLLYTVPISLGDTTTVVNLDTGSSDLWVITTNCQQNACAKARAPQVPEGGLTKTGANVTMRYGDSTTGTYASGNVAIDTVSVAGVAIDNQMYAAIEDTTNSVVQFGAAGIFGLGFPSGSQIQGAAVTHQFGSQTTTDHFVASSYADGPLISRIAQTNALEMPMFSITLQRSTIDISGKGELVLGSIPDGVDNSSITWVPVRLYTAAEGGLTAPTFAPNEVYPLRWEIDIDGVFLDGKQLPKSAIPTTDGVDASRMSALVDTGNSILRGPKDTVDNILGTVSPNYSPTVSGSATIPCAQPHNLVYQIGGKMFPIDPRDLIGPASDDASTCVVDNLVSTDAPGYGATFRWSLGAPFFRSNLVVFHYGNLTHPSQDPPRMGILSRVPDNANELLVQAVNDAKANGGDFDSTLVLAPTAQADAIPEVTVVPVAGSAQASGLTAAKPTPTPEPKTTTNIVNAPQASGGAGTKAVDGADKDKEGAAAPAVRVSWTLAVVAAAFGVVIGW